MPEMDANGVTLHYEEVGDGQETILFLHSLFFSGRIWAAQVAEFCSAYRCVTLDFRGQGGSPATDDGYDMDTLSRDVCAVIERLGGPVHLVGLSMGGFVALRIAARQPSLVRTLTLVGTSAEAEPAENMFKYRLAGLIGGRIGFNFLGRWIMPTVFGHGFLANPANAVTRDAWRTQIAGSDRKGVSRTLFAVVERAGVSEELRRIRAPALVMVGDEDVAATPTRSERLQAAIAGSRLVVIPGAGHSAPAEQPVLVNAALGEFLRDAAGK